MSAILARALGPARKSAKLSSGTSGGAFVPSSLLHPTRRTRCCESVLARIFRGLFGAGCRGPCRPAAALVLPKGSLSASRLDSKEDEIRHLLKLGVSKTAIAKITGVSRPALYSFMNTRGLRLSPSSAPRGRRSPGFGPTSALRVFTMPSIGIGIDPGSGCSPTLSWWTLFFGDDVGIGLLDREDELALSLLFGSTGFAAYTLDGIMMTLARLEADVSAVRPAAASCGPATRRSLDQRPLRRCSLRGQRKSASHPIWTPPELAGRPAVGFS